MSNELPDEDAGLRALADGTYMPPAINRFGEHLEPVEAVEHQGGPEAAPIGPDLSPAQMGTTKTLPLPETGLQFFIHPQPSDDWLVPGRAGMSSSDASKNLEAFASDFEENTQ